MASGRDIPGPRGDAGFRRAAPRPLVERILPISRDLRGYGAAEARGDVPAGLTVAALSLPAGMAYAEVAGLPPVAGLYALLLPTAVYVLIGSSRQLVVGPEASVATLTAAAVIPVAAGGGARPELAATLALMVAACFLVAWVARLDWIADYLSRPVLVGYLHGVAAVLLVGQLGKLLGVDVPNGRPLAEIGDALQALPDVSWATIAVSAAALALLVPLRYAARRVPAALVVVAGAIVASWLADLETRGVAVVGDLPTGLPSLALPSPALRDALELVLPAVGIFLVSYADGVLTARTFAGPRGEDIAARRELAAMGLGNLGAGLTGAFPIGANTSRTAAGDQAGARTQVTNVVALATAVGVLLFLTDPIAHLPRAVLGAVIVSAALGLVSRSAWRTLWSTDRVEFAIAAVTTAGVVLIGVLNALAIAVGLSIVDVVRRSARPHDAVLGWVERLGRWADVAVHRDAVTAPGIVVYRLDDRLFFANAGYFRARVREAVHARQPGVRWVVLNVEATVGIDTTGAEALRSLHADLAGEGIGMVMARAKLPLRERLRGTGLMDLIGEGNLHPTVRAAVAACGGDVGGEEPDAGSA